MGPRFFDQIWMNQLSWMQPPQKRLAAAIIGEMERACALRKSETPGIRFRTAILGGSSVESVAVAANGFSRALAVGELREQLVYPAQQKVATSAFVAHFEQPLLLLE